MGAHSSHVSKTLKNHPTLPPFPHLIVFTPPPLRVCIVTDHARRARPRPRVRPHTSTRRPIVMFTVRATSVQATSRVGLTRPARATRSVAVRAGKVRFVWRRARRGRRVHGRAWTRTPGTETRRRRPPIRTGRWPSIDRSPDRLSARYPSRARVVTGVARAMRDDDIFVAVARATNARARATATSVGRGRARAVSTSAARDARS